jgi:uncharacterized protein YggE
MISNKVLSAFFTFAFIISGINCTTLAQQNNQNSQRTISINMSATELIPADLIIFTININAEGKKPQDAFNIHKKRESVLASLLKEFEMKDEDIKFQPIRINKSVNYNNRQEEIVVQTNQQVSVSFSDFAIYEKIQVTLIENGFDSFNGSFSSTKLEEGKEKALVSAIQSAKERAQFIAKQSGVKLGVITTINYSEHQVTRPMMAMEDASMSYVSKSSMMDFEQTVSVTSNISINFEIIE